MSKEQPGCFLTKPQQKAVIPFYSLLYNNIGSDMSWFRQPEFEKYFSFWRFRSSRMLLANILTVVSKDGRVIFRVRQSKKCAGFICMLIWVQKSAKYPWPNGIDFFFNIRIGKWSDKYLFYVNAYLSPGGSVGIQNSERSLRSINFPTGLWCYLMSMSTWVSVPVFPHLPSVIIAQYPFSTLL